MTSVLPEIVLLWNWNQLPSFHPRNWDCGSIQVWYEQLHTEYAATPASNTLIPKCHEEKIYKHKNYSPCQSSVAYALKVSRVFTMLKLDTIRKKKKMGIYVILKNERSWRENKRRLLPLEARTGQNRSQVRCATKNARVASLATFTVYFRIWQCLDYPCRNGDCAIWSFSFCCGRFIET